MSSEFTVRELRDAFGQFGTGVTVITAVGHRGEPVGITANSMTSVSLDPPLLLWCLANKSSSTGAFAWHRRFNVHFLAEDQEDLAMQYARPSHEKFEAGNGEDEPEEPAKLEGVLARLECQVEALYPGGDHVIILGRVLGFERFDRRPLLFHGGKFGQLGALEPQPDFYPHVGDGWV